MKYSTVAFLALASVESVLAQSPAYGQCGGSGWTGPTTCVSGWCCQYSNPWYSQCLQTCSGASSTTTLRTSTTTTRAGTTTTTRTTTRASTTTTGANPAATTFCGQWDGVQTTNGYAIYNNLWGMSAATSGSQCTWYNGIVGSGVSWGTQWTWAGGPYNVKSYATSGKVVTPKIVSTIASMPSTFTWSYSGSNMICNVAYDLFTSANSAAETWNGDYELMIWLAAYGGAGPISSTGSPIATVTVAGHSWNLYYGLNGAMKVYSFVTASGNIGNFSGDIKAFYTYLTNSQGFPASSQYLLAFQAGTEPFTGSGTLSVSQYSAAVN